MEVPDHARAAMCSTDAGTLPALFGPAFQVQNGHECTRVLEVKSLVLEDKVAAGEIGPAAVDGVPLVAICHGW